MKNFAKVFRPENSLGRWIRRGPISKLKELASYLKVLRCRIFWEAHIAQLDPGNLIWKAEHSVGV
jgi:hypothetical protein